MRTTCVRLGRAGNGHADRPHRSAANQTTETADDGKGNIAAATVNWVTQAAFAPPLVVAGVKVGSGALETLKASRTFALDMLGKDKKSLVFTVFRPADVSEGRLSGQPYYQGTTGAPLLTDVPGAIECRAASILEQGDHHIVIAEVVEAHLTRPLPGRPDMAILEMTDLGDNVFYGG